MSEEYSKIKVCIISHFGYPLYNKKCKASFGGGAEVQLFLLSKELAKNEDFKIFVMTGKFSNGKYPREIFNNRIILLKVLPINRKLFNYFYGLLAFFFNLIKLNPDIVIQRTDSVLTGLSALYCRIFQKKFVFSIANEPNVNGEDEKGIIGKLFKFGINNADFIIAQNKSQILTFENYKKRKISNIKVIKSGYELNNNIDFIVKNYILWVARAVKWKKPELFIKLAKDFPHENFVMICSKDVDLRYWEKIFKRSKEIPNLKFIESVPFTLINKIFKEAIIFINTSTYEGFPNTFIQSFMNKTPVISLNVNPDDLFFTNRVGFYCKGDFTLMVKNLKFMINNPEIYL